MITTILVFIDTILTYIGIRKSGIKETNPLLNNLITSTDLLSAMVFKLIITIGFLYIIKNGYQEGNKTIDIILLSVMLIYAFVIINNLLIIGGII